jgi:hypothetical protein
MARTYDPSALTLGDPTSEPWALAWARQFAKDLPNEALAWPADGLSDEEWTAWVRATKLEITVSNRFTDTLPSPPAVGTVIASYYLPHVAAAKAFEANPYWVNRETISGYSGERPTAAQVASSILRAGSWVNRLVARAEQAAGRTYTGVIGEWPSVF